MSSICVQLCAQQLPDRAAVARALGAAPHRGTSHVISILGRCAIGVARKEDGLDDSGLAVEDDLVVGFCGTLDNLDDAAAGLADTERPNSPWHPAVAILRMWRVHGEATPALLRGAYAVAVTDGRQLWYFRDHLGVGTLYRRQHGDCHWAASEAKQIVAGTGIRREPSLEVLEAMFYGAEDDATGTALAGVDRVPKSVLTKSDGGTAYSRRYWEPERLLETGEFRQAELREQFDSLMTRAIGRVLRGDEVLALSGGIDSPSVAAFAARMYREKFGRPLIAFSQVFPSYPSCDETPYIEELVRFLGMEPYTYEPDPAERGLGRLQELVELFDGPWSGAWEPGMDAERYRRLRDLGHNTLLTGEWAEFVMDFNRHLLIHLVLNGRFRAAGRQLRAQRAGGAPLASIGRQLAGAVLPGSVLGMYRRWRPRFPPTDWIEHRRIVRAVQSESVSPWQRWRRQQLAAFRGPGITLEAYQTYQEAAGVRVRNPWGDIDLWEFFLSIPAEQKFPNARSKYLVRTFMRGRLPDAILDRRDKTVLDEFVIAGFDYPSLRMWFDHPEYQMPGVDYTALRRHLEAEDLTTFGYLWAKDLAGIHAFLATW
jgi:asparagine synthetase B (glutamine-hydrolysing)